MVNGPLEYHVEDLYRDPIPPNDAWGRWLSMRVADRPAYYGSLETSDQELLRKEVHRIKYFREYFKTRTLSTSDPTPVSIALTTSRSKWRKAAFERCSDGLATCKAKMAKSDDPVLKRDHDILRMVQLWETEDYSDLQASLSPESYIQDSDLRNSLAQDNPDESNYGCNGRVIFFEKGKGGVTLGHTLCTGKFPHQKVSVQQLLYNKSQTPLQRTENKNSLRYFHLPGNNMKWVEVHPTTHHFIAQNTDLT